MPVAKFDSKIIAVLVALCLVTIAVYAQIAGSPFSVMDDDDYVVRNLHVSSGLNLGSVAWACTTFHAANWHPLTWLSLMADSQLFGMNPMGYHLVNVALHAANAALLLLLLVVLTGELWPSAFVAALFALHPMHVESVAWIAERKDVLSAAFWMLTLLCYALSVKRSSRGMYLGSLAFFALGLMAKPMLVTIPVVLLLLDFWPLRRIGFPPVAGAKVPAERQGPAWSSALRRALREKIPFCALSALSCLLTLYAQSHGGAVAPLNRLGISDRVGNGFWSYLVYARKTVFPSDLALYYPLVPLPAWKGVVAFLVLCALAVAALRQARRYPYLAFGYFWYLVTLLPVAGFIQVGGQALADRYSYLPHIGLFVALSFGGAELCRRLPALGKVLLPAAGAALLLCALLTWIQVGYWQDNASIFRHALAVTTDNYVAYNGLGRAYDMEGKTDLAILQFNEALRIVPHDPEFLCNLGNALDTRGETAEAIGAYREALRGNPRLAVGHYNLGISLAKIGRLDEAIAEYNEELKLDPEDAQTRIDLGNALDDQGKTAEAIGHYQEALRLNPRFALGHYNLGIALEKQGKIDESTRHFSEAIRLNPDFGKAAQAAPAPPQNGNPVGRYK